MSNQPQGKKVHYKQLGPITKSLDRGRGRGRGRGHRAALAVWFTTLIRGPQWTANFGSNSNSNKQQATAATAATAGGPKFNILGTPIAQGPKLRAKGPLPKALLPTEFGPPTPGWRRSAVT